MAFIDNDQIGLWQIAASQRLHRTNLYRLANVSHFMVGLDHAQIKDSVLSKPFYGLVDQAKSRNDKHHPLALLAGHVDQRSGDDRLAAARGSLNDRPTVATTQCFTDFVDDVCLVVTEFQCLVPVVGVFPIIVSYSGILLVCIFQKILIVSNGSIWHSIRVGGHTIGVGVGFPH